MIRLTQGVLATPAIALAILCVVLASVELTARSRWAGARLPVPSIGGSSRYFDLKTEHLQNEIESHGRFDCYFLGSSLVLNSLSPAVFGKAYAAATGNPIRCFNAALPGAGSLELAPVARVIVEDYRPALVVYGASPRAMMQERLDLPSIPWLLYRTGRFTPEGWLVDHSRAYRYYLAGRIWLDPERRKEFLYTPKIPPDGFVANRGRLEDAETMLSAFEQTYAKRADKLGTRAQLSGFEQLFALRDQGVEVAVVQLPLHPLIEAWSDEKPESRRRGMKQLATLAAEHQVPVFQPPKDVIPEHGWADLWHMNVVGGVAFSDWLGKRIAAAVAAGDLPDPTGR